MLVVTLLVLSEIHFRITSVKLPVTSTTSLNSMLTKLSSELVRVGLCIFDIGTVISYTVSGPNFWFISYCKPAIIQPKSFSRTKSDKQKLLQILEQRPLEPLHSCQRMRVTVLRSPVTVPAFLYQQVHIYCSFHSNFHLIK